MLTVEHNTSDSILVITYDHTFDMHDHTHFIHEQIATMTSRIDGVITVVHDTRYVRRDLGELVTTLATVLRPNGLDIDFSRVRSVIVGQGGVVKLAASSIQQAELLDEAAIFDSLETALEFVRAQ